jgi:hypothetical protein
MAPLPQSRQCGRRTGNGSTIFRIVKSGPESSPEKPTFQVKSRKNLDTAFSASVTFGFPLSDPHQFWLRARLSGSKKRIHAR